MVKLKDGAISEGDLTAYLDTQSDFAFELEVLRLLEEHGFDCEHGGSYDDPVTQVPREFDLRSTRTIDKFHFRLAVECKNIGPNFPLLISCLPRRPEESFHEVIHSFDPPPSDGIYRPPVVMQQHAKAIRRSGEHSIYKPRERVGKSLAQVGRLKEGAIYCDSSDVYKKWAQALSSAQDLVDRANDERNCFSIVLPILVIPNGTLWVADFDSNGSKIERPHQVERCSYYIGRSYFGGVKLSGFNYQISHQEFVTYTGLEKIISGLFNDVRAVFPKRQNRRVM